MVRGASLICAIFLGSTAGSSAQPLDAPRPIAARESLFLEDLTWMEARDAIAAGKKTALVPTGGIEQSGPYLPLGKHNFVLSRTMELLAKDLGDALVAPVVKYVPEGGLTPPSGHMMFPGTISLRDDLFVETLKEIAKSLSIGGFTTIVFLGDSGDNQRGMKQATEELNREWSAGTVKAIFIPEYYDYRQIEKWLAGKGYAQKSEGIHDDLAFTAQLAYLDEHLVRYEERKAAGKLSINGIPIAEKDKIQSLGKEIIEMRVKRTAGIIRGRRRLAHLEATEISPPS